MSYHHWGSEDFDWKSLADAMNYIHNFVRKWTRCTVIMKEKYGTARYEHVFPPYGSVRAVGITIPFFKKQTRYGRVSRYISIWDSGSWLYRQYMRLGWYVTKIAIFKAVKKWPHIEDELLEDFATHEHLVGKEIHSRYWR